MAIDLRKTLRRLGQLAQEDLVRRLTGGEDVFGGSVAPRVDERATTSTRKRVRILGERVSLRDLAGTVGVRTGELLKELQKRSNLKVTRTGFKFVPGASVLSRWFAFNAGSKHQVARHVGGITGERARQCAEDLVKDARDQVANEMRPGGS